MKITAIIPARLGSSRIEEKVLLPFGKEDTLLSWKIKQLKNILPNKQIYVSSESEKILNIARSLNVMTHRRDFYLSDGHKASFSEVVYGIVKEIESQHIAWTTVVCPLMTLKDIKKSFISYEKLIKNNSYDSLVGVNLVKDYFWDKSGPLNYEATKNHTISQNLPNWYKVTNSIYIAPKKIMLEKKYVLGKNPKLEELSRFAGVDIDDWFDYQVAKSMLKEQQDL